MVGLAFLIILIILFSSFATCYINLQVCKDGFTSELFIIDYRDGINNGYVKCRTISGNFVELKDPGKRFKSEVYPINSLHLIKVQIKPTLKWIIILNLELQITEIGGE